ncbi:RNA polymerase sigma factor [Lunatibacter salilacus]|uniref:RNA polymerase sigma factor n=1 Tax=Lunatibacter salilacus TaxID=2483804 RepID=UPI00131A9D0B|nr:sigma-70 family RNA polymerase sigma factor [Lunatibacter salilacus]
MNRKTAENAVNLEKTPEELWVELTLGDKKAFEQLYRRYINGLFQLGISLCGNPDFVQDCIQELFIDLWKYRRSIKETDNVKSYLFRSLSNKMNAERKKEGRWLKRQSSTAFALSSHLESIETELVHLQRDEQLQKKLALALKKLPVRQNEIIQYLFFENQSYEDTAKLMDINLRSVYTLAWKALSSLRKTIYALCAFGFSNF